MFVVQRTCKCCTKLFYKVTKLQLGFSVNLYSGVVMEKIAYKPQEQGHGHLVSPQAFSLLFEFFYHSP